MQVQKNMPPTLARGQDTHGLGGQMRWQVLNLEDRRESLWTFWGREMTCASGKCICGNIWVAAKAGSV